MSSRGEDLGTRASDVAQKASDTAEQVQRRGARWLRPLARAGYAASGLLHLLIGGIAARVALGGSGDADQGGALESLRSVPAGEIALWACTVGLAALAVWQLLELLAGGGELTDRAKAGGKAVLYAAMAGTAGTIAAGGTTDSGQSTADLTATLLAAPLGQALVVAVGLAVLVTGGYHVYKGVTKKFLEDLEGTGGGKVGRGVELAGVIGYTAKGVALGVVGVLFGLAALRRDPEEATGLDGALKVLADQTGGEILLLAVALGLVLFGVYCFARAARARM